MSKKSVLLTASTQKGMNELMERWGNRGYSPLAPVVLYHNGGSKIWALTMVNE